MSESHDWTVYIESYTSCHLILCYEEISEFC